MFVKRFLVLVALLGLPTVALAKKADTVQQVFHVTAAGSQNLLNGVACSAAEADLTVTLTLKSGLARTELSVFFTDTDSSTTFTVTPTCSMDASTYASYTTRSCASGTCTVTAMSDSFAAGDANYKVSYDVSPCKSVKFVLACSASNSDSFIVQAVSLTGGE